MQYSYSGNGGLSTTKIIVDCCSNTPLRIWFDGFAAVTFFFVLSGFVLARSVQGTQIGFVSILQFLARRIVRIWPPYVICIIIATLIFTAVIMTFRLLEIHNLRLENFIETLSHSDLHAWKVIQWFLLLPVGAVNPVVPQAWTLSLEILFSLCIPLFVYFESKFKVNISLIGLLISLIFTGIYVHIFPFCLGLLLAKYENKIKDFSKPVGGLILLIGLYFYTIGFGYQPFSIISNNIAIWHLTALGSGLIILAFVKLPTLQKISSSNILVSIGSMSYSIYLLHFFVVRNTMPFLLGHINNVFTPQISWYIGLATALFITLILSATFTKFIDLPIARFSNRLFRN